MPTAPVPPPPAAPPGPESAADDPELRWLREVYQGDNARQLTVRAVITGMLLGGVMSLSNLYTALKAGWSFGVTITAGILAYAIFSALQKTGAVKTHFGMLENNAMQSVASAAGYMTGGGTVAAIPALMMETHQTLPGYVIFCWIIVIALLGVFMAIPMKRQMINQEQLRFPSGIAAAEMLRGLHPEEASGPPAAFAPPGADASYRAPGGVVPAKPPASGANLLLAGGLVAAVYKFLQSASWRGMPWPNLPEAIKLPWKLNGVALSKWSISLDTSLLLIAAGGIMGWRAAWSVMLGAAINYGFLAPYGQSIGAISEVKYSNIVKWTLWFGSSLMLTSGLLSFAFSWKQVARAFRDLGKVFGKPTGVADPLADVEVPMRWFVLGVGVLVPVVLVTEYVFFGIAWYVGILCIVMSFFIAIVAARATGETDVTPTGALGKITQLVFGVVAPGSVTTNLMTANLSAGVALHSADLLTDLKSGYLLGAKPRQQFFAQFFGVLAGSLFVVPAFRLLVSDYRVLGTTAWPAPGAVSWAAVAHVLSRGLSQLPTSARWLIGVGAVVGIVMTLAERAFPKAKKYLPQPLGFGLAFTMPASNAISMFIGALLALIYQKRKPDTAERTMMLLASGVIAGESLMGIVVEALKQAHVFTAGH